MPNTAKELYCQLRLLSWDQLWNQEAAGFNRASPRERTERVAVIRAVGVVFAEAGPAEQRDAVRGWLRGLLNDPGEKVRRYAMTALPKIGAGPEDEAALLSLLRTTVSGREKEFVMRTLEKIGGRATLRMIEEAQGDLPRQTEQKVKAGIARVESPSAIRMDAVLSDLVGVQIHLRGRRGLEGIVRDEVQDSQRARGKFRVAGIENGLVGITPLAPFSLADIYSHRCFGTAAFALDAAATGPHAESVEALAPVIASSLSRSILESFTLGTIRYRLNFADRGHQRSAVRLLAARVYALCPQMLNDPRNVTWTVDIYGEGRGRKVELRPNVTPDPRFSYRRQDVPAASHPPLAACMARLAGKAEHEIIWDPFCGSGLELIERALLGGVERIHGTDRSASAIAIARGNLAAASVDPASTQLACCEFRDYAAGAGLGPNRVTLLITNPPMGKRVPIPDLRGLIGDLFAVAATVLKPGGRLVMANPLPPQTPPPALQLRFRQTVDFGGFDCRLEMYQKRAGRGG